VIFVGTVCAYWWWAASRPSCSRGGCAGAAAPARARACATRGCCARRCSATCSRKVEVARFARTLATLLGNGVTLLAASRS
jgi:type II secretory pathway component PulF